jgi:N-acetylglutamate synthase-like GNAT family acetyltransferase
MNNEFLVRSATNLDCERVQTLVFGVLHEYGLQPDLTGTDLDLTNLEANYIDRGGIFELIEDHDGNLLGTVGLFPMNSKTVELRKMYFAKELRGKGFGKITLQRMINEARELGFKKIFLETASVLKEAIGLYESFGFKQTSEKHTSRCDVAYYLEI